MSLGVKLRSPFAFETLMVWFGPEDVDVPVAASEDVVVLPEP